MAIRKQPIMEYSSDGKELTSLEAKIGNEAVIIEMLRSNFYTYKITTPVQEYICNARDANREVGAPDNKIDIKLPTTKDPNFSIRDYGPGLTRQRMEEVFMNFGVSTKRDSDVFTGEKGIGGKSFLAYSEQFIIVSYVDGVQDTWVYECSSNFKGVCHLLDSAPTSEPNGVKVQIVVKEGDFEAFHNAVVRCTMFWEDRLPGMNYAGVEITPSEIFPEIKSYTSAIEKGTLVVLDGIPYKVDLNKLIKYKAEIKYNKSLAIFPPKGVSYDPTPSRESLADSDVTNKGVGQWIIDKFDELYEYNDTLTQLQLQDYYKKLNSIFYRPQNWLYSILRNNRILVYKGNRENGYSYSYSLTNSFNINNNEIGVCDRILFLKTSKPFTRGYAKLGKWLAKYNLTNNTKYDLVCLVRAETDGIDVLDLDTIKKEFIAPTKITKKDEFKVYISKKYYEYIWSDKLSKNNTYYWLDRSLKEFDYLDIRYTRFLKPGVKFISCSTTNKQQLLDSGFTVHDFDSFEDYKNNINKEYFILNALRNETSDISSLLALVKSECVELPDSITSILEKFMKTKNGNSYGYAVPFHTQFLHDFRLAVKSVKQELVNKIPLLNFVYQYNWENKVVLSFIKEKLNTKIKGKVFYEIEKDYLHDNSEYSVATER